MDSLGRVWIQARVRVWPTTARVYLLCCCWLLLGLKPPDITSPPSLIPAPPLTRLNYGFKYSASTSTAPGLFVLSLVVASSSGDIPVGRALLAATLTAVASIARHLSASHALERTRLRSRRCRRSPSLLSPSLQPPSALHFRARTAGFHELGFWGRWRTEKMFLTCWVYSNHKL